MLVVVVFQGKNQFLGFCFNTILGSLYQMNTGVVIQEYKGWRSSGWNSAMLNNLTMLKKS